MLSAVRRPHPALISPSSTANKATTTTKTNKTDTKMVRTPEKIRTEDRWVKNSENRWVRNLLPESPEADQTTPTPLDEHTRGADTPEEKRASKQYKVSAASRTPNGTKSEGGGSGGKGGSRAGGADEKRSSWSVAAQSPRSGGLGFVEVSLGVVVDDLVDIVIVLTVSGGLM